MKTIAIFLIPVVLALLLLYRQWRLKCRIRYIQQYDLPPRLARELKKRYPDLDDRQIHLVLDGLREYFIIGVKAGRKMVAMPSQAVDVVWHEFILETRHYQQFCRKAFGRFFHHTPSDSMPRHLSMQKGMQVAWKLSCRQEKINAKLPMSLPLLYAIDSQLSIPDGFSYDHLLRPGNLHRNNQSGYGGYAGGCGGSCSGGNSSSGSSHSDSSGGNCSGGCSGGCGGS